MKAGLRPGEQRHAQPRIDAVPFESERQYMATLHGTDSDKIIFVKGAPEVLLDRCTASDPAQLGNLSFDLRQSLVQAILGSAYDLCQ